MNHLWKLLAGLSIPHLTLLDLDMEREGGGAGRIRMACKELLAIGVPRSPLLDVEMAPSRMRSSTSSTLSRSICRRGWRS